jgi:hypothetical protein
MQRFLLLSLSLAIAFPGFVAAQSSPRPTATPAPTTIPSTADAPAPDSVDALDPADVQKAISLIEEKYVKPAAVTGPEVNRATLQGFLDRLDRGAMLMAPRGAPTPTPPPFYREIIGGHIGYLRPGDLNESQLQELDTTLRGFAGKRVDAIVLDLRGSVPATDFAAAAEFANRFILKDKPLFQLRSPSGTPVDFVSRSGPGYSGIVIGLIDQETIGATEVLAAVLHENKAILIGERTAGRPIQYADLPLPSGKILRLAVAEATLMQAEPRLDKGVAPDLAVALPLATKDEMFQQSLTQGMAPFVFENDRPHLNEAALLAGTNPEIEAAAAAQQRRLRGERPPPHDPVLQRAVDVITSIGVYEKQPGRPP